MWLNPDGTMWIAGGLYQNSDYRIKKHLGDATPVLERLCSISMFNYELNGTEDLYKTSGNKIGFYAHDLKDTFSEIESLVINEKDALEEDGSLKTQSVDVFQLSNILMKAIQELNEIVQAQQIQINNLMTLVK